MTDWKRKLAAYLHDPPSKCLDIRTHGERSDAAFRQAGFIDTEVGEYFAYADYTGAAADRFPFPSSLAAGLRCSFDGVRSNFHHPLNGQPLAFHTEFKSVEEGFEGENSIQPALTKWPEDWAGENEWKLWRARYFAHWRLWPQFAMEKDYRLGLLPADTRIPDHSIWTHMQVVSALAGCVNHDKVWQPAFLKFQLGPVQEFIAQARSTRDLWSGSYLLSWLMAAGLKALSAEVGPDAVIFPNLRSQPLFDLHWRDELWSQIRIGEQSVWDSLRERAQQSLNENPADNPELDLLTPNLPNVFLAVVPADRAAELAGVVKKAIQDEWHRIHQSVWKKVEPSRLMDCLPPKLTRDTAWKRFNAQCDRFLSLAWQALQWPQTLAEAREQAAQLPSADPAQDEKTLLQRFDSVVAAATQAMPKDHRDPRYYASGQAGPKDSLNNVGIGWALLTAVSGWGLDAVRQTRDFPAWQTGGWQEPGVAQSKDALTGREEMLFGGRGFRERVGQLSDPEWAMLFKHDDEIGAFTLVKRVWHWSWLADQWRLKARRGQFPMPNTRTLADHRPYDDDAEEDLDSAGDESSRGKYFAVLALDGDSVGKWVSGDKTPRYATQLAGYPDANGNPQGALEYFTRQSDPDGRGELHSRFADLLRTRRLVSPSYHLQFSESLSHFALLCARPIVEAFAGRLIYAGGDDVMAMLPADTALACARALRAAFQGAPVVGPDGASLFTSPAPGFLATESWRDNHGQGRPIPFLVPGPAADCSVGIAVAHFKSPLQDVVRAARDAEKRAKNQLGRSAVAVTLIKRSGETIEWGARWEGGLELYQQMAQSLEAGELSNKFPHRFAELLEAYIVAGTPLVAQTKAMQPVAGFPVDAIIHREFEHCLGRQRGDRFPREKEKAEAHLTTLRGALERYLGSLAPDLSNPSESLSTEKQLQAVIGLCQTVAFAHRTRDDGNDLKSAISNLNSPSAERQPA